MTIIAERPPYIVQIEVEPHANLTRFVQYDLSLVERAQFVRDGVYPDDHETHAGQDQIRGALIRYKGEQMGWEDSPIAQSLYDKLQEYWKTLGGVKAADPVSKNVTQHIKLATTMPGEVKKFSGN